MTSFVAYIGEATGLFRPIEDADEDRHLTVEYFLSISACFFLMGCYIFHPNSLPQSLMGTVTRGMGMNEYEMRLFDMARAIHELEGKFGHKIGARSF